MRIVFTWRTIELYSRWKCWSQVSALSREYFRALWCWWFVPGPGDFRGGLLHPERGELCGPARRRWGPRRLSGSLGTPNMTGIARSTTSRDTSRMAMVVEATDTTQLILLSIYRITCRFLSSSLVICPRKIFKVHYLSVLSQRKLSLHLKGCTRALSLLFTKSIC